MARTDPQLNIRIPSELKDRLEEAATASGRSVTAELIHRIEVSLRADEITSTHVPASQLKQILDRLDRQQRDIAAIGGKVGVTASLTSKKKPAR